MGFLQSKINKKTTNQPNEKHSMLNYQNGNFNILSVINSEKT